MRRKRAIITPVDGVQEGRAQPCDLFVCGALGPEQAWPSPLRPITDALKTQLEGGKSGGYLAKLVDGLGDGGLVPRRDKGQVNVGGRNQPNGWLLEPFCKTG